MESRLGMFARCEESFKKVADHAERKAAKEKKQTNERLKASCCQRLEEGCLPNAKR